jgi:hypothetical protein
MLDCLCKGPVHNLQIVTGALLIVAILVLAWLTWRRRIEGFVNMTYSRGPNQLVDEGFQAQQADANVVNFNLFRQQWADAAVKSGLIAPVYFPTYQSIMSIPAPQAGVNRSDFEVAIKALAQMIKVWYVNAKYRGNLASLAAAVDSSVPKYVEPPKGAGDFPVIPVKVAANSAEAGTIDNINNELNTFFKPLLPYYEQVIRLLAQTKVDPGAADVKGEVERAMPQVEIEVTAAGPVAPLLSINRRIKEIQEGDGSEFLKSAAILSVLPDKVDLYLSTLNFATMKAQEAYKYVSSIGQTAGGPKMPPVQGSTAATLGVSSAIDSALFFADAGGQGPLAALKVKYKEKPDDVANTYYRISQTRRRLLDEIQRKFTESMKVAKETFSRLEALQKQAGDAVPTVFANVAAGEPLLKAA